MASHGVMSLSSGGFPLENTLIAEESSFAEGAVEGTGEEKETPEECGVISYPPEAGHDTVKLPFCSAGGCTICTGSAYRARAVIPAASSKAVKTRITRCLFISPLPFQTISVTGSS